ncbi:YceD family protein [Ottowia testudinis]|uniref:Large ribosomal RNA subunit accumulation protein YceD n=1 Tax=Ottowia testudinis TaxID=2816950 RepID=A0A975CE56_9BURK|nr:DUF177 domain-containing protein [Ottowia testudinis]QTD43869.1 DUF177 domain-containing protein [Ottowia testudinis]
MSKTFNAQRLDVAAFADARAVLSGTDTLQKYERLAHELQAPAPDLTVGWRAAGGPRKASSGSVYPSIHLQIEAALPLTCQRCMGEVITEVEVDRHFLFVPDEATAAALDDMSDDDVLAIAPDFNLAALIEDELLMALPLVPRHDACPVAVRLETQSDDFDGAQAAKRQPFAALAALRTEKKSD